MNEPDTPPVFTQESVPTAPVRPAEDPANQEPIRTARAAVEALLRQPGRVQHQLDQPGSGGTIAALLVAAFGGALVYGFVAGTFSGGTQLWAAPLKIAIGLVLSSLICLPSLYIFACLGGSTARMGAIAGNLAGLLALMVILLLGFAPVAWVFAQSTNSVAAMGALHLVFWAVATAFGLRFFLAGFERLKARSLAGLRVWIVVFVLVMLQMSTALRPIVGQERTLLPTEKKSFLVHWGECLGNRP
jgi:hypothetical protein